MILRREETEVGEGRSTLPLSQSRSDSKAGLAETVVVAERWAGSSVTLMLELMGKMSFSSRFPQYLMTAILLGARPVLVTTHSFPSFPIAESSSHPPTHTHTNWNKRNQQR